ncbi:MAG: hypothetical protein ACPGQS_02980 [Bradymonadia bacterium]
MVIGRELLCWALAGASLAFLAGHNFIFIISVLTLFVLICVMLFGSLLTNARRTKIIQGGTCVDATLDTPRRLTFLHEFLKQEREKTFVLHYTYVDHAGHQQRSSIWVCGCAREYFPSGSKTPVVFRKSKPSKGIPLRLGVMIAPH